MSVYFLTRDRKSMDLDAGDGKELGEVGEGETITRIYCMEKYILIKEKNNTVSDFGRLLRSTSYFHMYVCV